MKPQLLIQTKILNTLPIKQLLAWLHQQGSQLKFVWENPSKDYLLLGCGQIIQISPQKAVSFADLNTLLNQARHQIVNLDAKTAAHLKVVGGFPFLTTVVPNSYWQNLHNGRLWIPQIIIEQTPSQTSLTAIGSDFTALKVQLQTITQQLTAITPLAAQSYNLSNFKELAVSAYQQRLQAVLKLIAKNKLQKVVLGRFATAQIPPAIPEAIWLQLRQSQPQVYHVLLQDHTTAFLSATPERLLAINHQQLQTAAVAGSIRRGTTPGQDKQLQQQLLHDTKNLKEHAFVSNWLQQALQQLHLQVEVSAQPQILTTATIQHLYTPIQARGNMDVASILAKLHPTPALGGIPKSSALNWLQESESEAREMFGAPIGYLAADGQGEFAVGIRSALLTPLQLRLFAGSGIVAGSQINTETQETAKKFQAILSAFQTPKE